MGLGPDGILEDILGFFPLIQAKIVGIPRYPRKSQPGWGKKPKSRFLGNFFPREMDTRETPGELFPGDPRDGNNSQKIPQKTHKNWD